jgi:hypothetical protein
VTDHLEIKSSSYRLVVRLVKMARGERVVHVKVWVRLKWAVPMEFKLYLPGDDEALRAMLHAARGGYFPDWLAEHGYDEYGNGKGDWGEIV